MKLLTIKQSLIAIALAFLRPGVIPLPSASINGANLDIAQEASQTASLGINGESIGLEYGFTANATAAITISNMAGQLYQLTNGGATVITLDSAYNIVNNLPKPQFLGQVFAFQVMTNAGTTIATPTLLSTDVTLAGTTSMLASALRWYRGVITQLTSTVGCPLTVGSTYTSITQIGSSNLFTVALGTNALVPVVGTLIYLGVTAGTLPPGWYPIVKVTSATSFVIATPLGQVWTCTAATLNATGGGQVAPVTYAPTITVTGIMTNAANMAV